jgi:hypothetical protein
LQFGRQIALRHHVQPISIAPVLCYPPLVGDLSHIVRGDKPLRIKAGIRLLSRSELALIVRDQSSRSLSTMRQDSRSKPGSTMRRCGYGRGDR